MHPLPQQRGHPFTSGLMLHYWKAIETLIGNYWKAGLQGQIKASEMLVAPRISECFDLPLSLIHI